VLSADFNQVKRACRSKDERPRNLHNGATTVNHTTRYKESKGAVPFDVKVSVLLQASTDKDVAASKLISEELESVDTESLLAFEQFNAIFGENFDATERKHCIKAAVLQGCSI
jgi:hypothetical protein